VALSITRAHSAVRTNEQVYTLKTASRIAGALHIAHTQHRRRLNATIDGEP